ncbi:MAG TPA: acetate uptake transporter, partial [Candidatus Saccharimonadales bacterium]|nr:acetate uptake transporter [Candidatus Saccharimonadales bacterium]
LLPKTGAIAAPDENAKAAYLACWGVFTGVMFVGTLRLNRALQFVFLSLTILFFLLAYGEVGNVGAGFKHFTGWEGVACGLSAMYAGLAQVLNELARRAVLPLGPVQTS